MPFVQRGDARIYFEESGKPDGFPLLLISPGGMNSAIAFWARMPFNPIDSFAADFRILAMDQRNCGQSTGPLDTVDPWGSFVDDQMAVLDAVGVNRHLSMGCCIGGSYLLKQAERYPGRMVAGVLEQPIGLVETNTEVFQDRIWKGWGEDLAANRSDITMDQVLAFGKAMWNRPFIFSVPKDFIPSITTPFLVLPGNDPAHPESVGLELARLLPNATLLEHWREPAEVVPQTVERIRQFLTSHATAGVA